MQQQIDRQSKRTSVDEATNRGRLVPKVKSDMSDTHTHGEEISDDAYATLMRHQFNLESKGGHFTRYPKLHPNPIRKTRTEIRTKVAKYPNGY